MSKDVLVPIADGCEEIEAACIIDVLRRADADVTVASVGNLQVTASRGMKLVADKLISECVNDSYDLIALPGGMPGAERLRDSKELTELLTAPAAGWKIVCGNMCFSRDSIASSRTPGRAKGNCVSGFCRTACKY